MSQKANFPKLVRPSWISDQNHFSYFDLQVTLILPVKFPVNGSFRSGEEFKIDFQDATVAVILYFWSEAF